MFITVSKLHNNSRYTLIFPYQIKDHEESEQDFWRNGKYSWVYKQIIRGQDTFAVNAKLHDFLNSIPQMLWRKIDQIDIAWERSDRMDVRLNQTLTNPEEADLFNKLSKSFCLSVKHI